jgi:hypothetical protein
MTPAKPKRETYINGKPETEWAFEQVSKHFGFRTLSEVRRALQYDEDGLATIEKNGLQIIGTTNKKAWAPLRIAWRGVGSMRNEAALEYSARYLKDRSA